MKFCRFAQGRFCAVTWSLAGASFRSRWLSPARLIERIFDGIWLCLCLILAVRLVGHHHHMRGLVASGYVLGMVVLSGAALLALAVSLRQKTRALFSGEGWQRHVRVLIDDLNLIGHSRYLYFAFFQSLPYLLLQVIPIYAAMRAYEFDWSTGFVPSLTVAFVLMVILRFGSVVPQAPGNLGLFQFLTKEALQRMFHVAPAEAARFSLVLWGTVTLPLLSWDLSPLCRAAPNCSN